MKMKIQSPGEQKYYDFIQERTRRLRTGMIIWGSLLCMALISAFSDPLIAAGLGAVGIVHAVLNLRSQRELSGKLLKVKDRPEFFRQLSGPDRKEFPELRVIVTRDYVLTQQKDLEIYQKEQMKKVEVGIRKGEGKTLFLTDEEGVRHEVASCTDGSGQESAFDGLYRELHQSI